MWEGGWDRELYWTDVAISFFICFTVCLCLLFFLCQDYIFHLLSPSASDSFEMDSPLPVSHLLIGWHENLSASFTRSRSVRSTTCCFCLASSLSLGAFISKYSSLLQTQTPLYADSWHLQQMSVHPSSETKVLFSLRLYLKWRLNTKIVKKIIIIQNTFLLSMLVFSKEKINF